MKNILLLSFVILCFSCQQRKNIDFEIPFEGEKLVVYSVIGNNFDSYLNVYRSVPVLIDSPSVALEGIEAVIYADGETFMTIPFNENIGEVSTIFEEDKTYTLEVKHEELSVLSEPIEIPQKIEIDSFTVSLNADSSRVTYRIYFYPSDHSLEYVEARTDFYSNGQKIKLRTDGDLLMEEPDSLMNNLVIASRSQEIDTGDENFQPVTIDKVVAKLYHYSPARNIFRESTVGGGLLGDADPYTEPTPPISNIIDGYGYFSAVNVDSIVIEW